MTPEQNLEAVLAVHRDAATRSYEILGKVGSKLWAAGNGALMIAEEIRSGRRDIDMDDFARASILVGMSLIVEGRVLGRTDEGYTKTVRLDNGEYEPGDLIANADQDPSIYSCVMVEAITIEEDHALSTVSVHSLDDEGRSRWATQEFESPGESLIPLYSARMILNDPEALDEFPRGAHALEQFADEFGWKLNLYSAKP